mmetsp:Transcript_41442/g.70963  ORF Transcript_41442/g.70963 Transcript_41442/m.70963 type:complete len:253 (+) Transcript_41442:150-908(+)|eukprot:CAMPEP_0183788310 /NCGR_PEP_ID=MMETSP0739-20130205/67998_1 /TAXON_ID=385413 /ORGANISM="Thalassiosira miniscula, Strain CCMP1093" /LENGTH=252 /DNA_ID=CAMNT_0026032429 /DNA_START=47 /DNA_END=805 /DNA_ORIENTATION=+
MSGGRGYEGGRTRMGTKVILNIYDLSPANDFLYSIGMGLHHSGVEILGREYSFASGGGIFDSSPKEAPGAQFREAIELGAFDGGSSELQSAISDLREEFGPDRYNLIRRNCNHFANALVWRLLNRTIPGHVNRLADFGVCCSCLLPKKLLEEAPVGPNAGGNSSGGASGFQAFGRPGTSDKKNDGASSSSTIAFTGSGAALGGSQESESRSLLGSWRGGTAKKGEDSLTDRREKARMAALARMNNQGDSESE